MSKYQQMWLDLHDLAGEYSQPDWSQADQAFAERLLSILQTIEELWTVGEDTPHHE